MTRAEPTPCAAVGQWLDAPVRQVVVELALAGAHHSMYSQARVILQALPSLVTDRQTCQWLHAALLIALGDTRAARAHLAEIAEIAPAGHGGNPTADVLARWLDAMDTCQSTAPVALAVPKALPAASSASSSSRSRPPSS